MINRILCWFGIHDWQHTNSLTYGPNTDVPTGIRSFCRCRRCGLKKNKWVDYNEN